VSSQYAANLLADADGGVKRERRLLKDESDSIAADLTEFLGTDLKKIFAFKQDGAAADLAVGRKKAQDRCRERAFARTGFTEDTQNFARHQIETYARQNRARADFAREIGNLKILDFKNGRHGPAALGPPPLRFMVRQEAGRDKGNLIRGSPKVIRYRWKQSRMPLKGRIAGIQEGGIPAILVWVNWIGPFVANT